MPSLFLEKMSSAERAKLADSLMSSAADLPAEERHQLISKLSEALAGELKAAAATDKTKAVLAKIEACHADIDNGGKNQLQLANGTLSRAGIEPIEKLAFKAPREINSILASASKLSLNDRFAVKGLLFKLGALPQ